jgi:hypothetical protein
MNSHPNLCLVPLAAREVFREVFLDEVNGIRSAYEPGARASGLMVTDPEVRTSCAGMRRDVRQPKTRRRCP